MAYSYETIKNILSYAVALKPDSAFPLDARSYFGSYAAAVVAAQSAKAAGSTESEYFYGQQIYVVENDVVTTYLIQVDGSLSEVGAKTLGDDKTISLNNGVLSLKSFGTGYYAYVAATEDEPAKHVYTEGWKSGLEPKVIASASGEGYELAWYEPSTTTVEGLNSVVATIQTDVNTLSDTVASNKTAAEQAVADEAAAREAADNGIIARVEANENALTTLNGDASTEGSVLKSINDVLAQLVGDGSQATIDSLTELVEWANEHDTEIVDMNNQINKNKTDIAAMDALLGDLPEGITSTTVIAYIAEAVAAETARAEAAEKALGDRITAVEDVADGLGTAATKNVEDFATADQGAKADTAIQSVVAGANGHIAVDNNDVTVYELPKASITELGGVKPDGASINADANGVISVQAVDYTKVTGLETQLTATKEAAVSEANTYTDENAISVDNIVTSSNVADTVEAASEGKVISEKLLLEALTWKEEM